jgi:hypothetical protein
VLPLPLTDPHAERPGTRRSLQCRAVVVEWG